MNSRPRRVAAALGIAAALAVTAGCGSDTVSDAEQADPAPPITAPAPVPEPVAQTQATPPPPPAKPDRMPADAALQVAAAGEPFAEALGTAGEQLSGGCNDHLSTGDVESWRWCAITALRDTLPGFDDVQAAFADGRTQVRAGSVCHSALGRANRDLGQARRATVGAIDAFLGVDPLVPSTVEQVTTAATRLAGAYGPFNSSMSRVAQVCAPE